MNPLDAVLDAALVRNPPAHFIAPASQARMRRVAACLPSSATDFFGFECRLNDGSAESDFLVCVERDNGEAAALARALEHTPPTSDPFWAHLAGFCRDWAEGSAPWHPLIQNIWLEFDLAGMPAPGGVPLPSVFVGTRALGAGATMEAANLVNAALARLAGGPATAERRVALRQALGALPPGGTLFQIGIMLPRADPRLRICARDIAPDALPGYLRALGHSDPQGSCAALIARLAPHAAELRLGLDVGAGGVAPRVGIEAYAGNDPQAAARWQALYRLLLADGLATAEDITALQGWWGFLHQRLLASAWPSWLDWHPQRPQNTTSGAISRFVHHLKLAWSDHAPPSAKVYLAARLNWVDDAVLAEQIRTIAVHAPEESTIDA